MKTMTYIPDNDDEFRNEYIFAFNQMIKYNGRVGSRVWADRMALLYDARPDFCDIIEESMA